MNQNEPRQSEQIDQIANALSELRSRMATVGKSAANPFFKSRYTPLEDIVDSIRPHLRDLGLSFTQGGMIVIDQVSSGDTYSTLNRMVLATKIMHKSGQWIESYFPLDALPDKNGAVTPQAWGSASSYARRYGLQAAFGIATGDVDDDGNMASGISVESTRIPSVIKPPSSPAKIQTDVAVSEIRNNDWNTLWAIAESKGMKQQLLPMRVKGFGVVAEALGLKVISSAKGANPEDIQY